MSRLQKAINAIIRPQPGKEARGTVSGFSMGVSPLWGQPYPEVQSQDASGLISRARMREVVLRTPTAAACMNAILDFTGGVKIDVRHVDAAKPVPKLQAKKVKAIMDRPNRDQTKRQFLLTLIRDLITFGYAAIEIVQTPSRPDLWVIDSARLKVDFDEHGMIQGYDMVDARGVPIIGKANKNNIYDFPTGMNMGVTSQQMGTGTDNDPGNVNNPGTDLHGWEPEEVILFSLNPISESVYPHSRIVQLFTSAVLEDLMMQFIAERFTDSNIPFGVFDLGDVTEAELKMAIDNWNTQGKTGNRILMTGSKGAQGSKWTPFGYHLKDLEATELLKEFRMKIMGILGVTMQELGESQDVNRSNGYNLSFTFKKRAIEPILEEICQTLTKRLLWETLGMRDLEYYFEEIDSRDDFLMSQIDTNYEKLGILNINEIRNRRGETSINGGEENLIFTGNAWIPVDLLRDMAKSLIAIEQAGSISSITGPEGATQARIKPPQTSTGNSNSGAGEQVTSGHKRGASSEVARHLGSEQ
jgi:phage portal protein BeeE